MFHCRFVDDSLTTLWKDIFGTFQIPTETLLIFFVFDVLTSESFIFHCWCIDDSLMIPWRNIEVTAIISMQTLRIINVFIDIISETLMFHCCFVDDRWRLFGETYFKNIDNFDGTTFLIFVAFVVLTSGHCFSIASTLMIRWWLFEEPLMTLRIFGRKRFWSVKFLMCCISIFDVSLLLD